MLKQNQPQTTYDLAELLKGEEGTYLAQRAGQTFVVESQAGHSIKSIVPVGCIESSQVPAGSNPPWTVTRIDNLTGQETGGQRSFPRAS